MNKFHEGQSVIYHKKTHDLTYRRFGVIYGRIVRLSKNRVVLRDIYGHKHFVKPDNLTAASTKRKG